MNTCQMKEISECSNSPGSKGMCRKHYEAYKRKSSPVCEIDDCEKRSYAKGLCRTHYSRKLTEGHPLKYKRPKPTQWLKEMVRTAEPGKCIEWPFSIRSTGYGQIVFNGVPTNAHRAALILHSGIDRQDMFAAHEPVNCHNRSCVNPHHLRWATRKENEKDRVMDKTDNRGERCAAAKLKEPNVLTIRVSELPPKELANQFGVSTATVQDIKSRRTWKHI